MSITSTRHSVSHTKASLVGSSVVIPITNGLLNLGTWQGEGLTGFSLLLKWSEFLQGIYLTEFRHIPHARRIVATIL